MFKGCIFLKCQKKQHVSAIDGHHQVLSSTYDCTMYKIEHYKEADRHSIRPDSHEDILHSTNENPIQPREIPLIN